VWRLVKVISNFNEISVIRSSRVSGVQSVSVPGPLRNTSSFQFLNLRRCLNIEWRRLKNEKEKEKRIRKRSRQAHQNQLMHFTNTLDRVLIFLKGMVNEHVFMSLVSLGEI
jgi:hypothetical protein